MCTYETTSIILQAIGLISLIIATVSFILKKKTEQANFLIQLHRFYFDDPKMLKIYNEIEWNGNNFEVYDYKLDMEKFLGIFEFFLMLKKKGLITIEETTIYDYMIEKIKKNSSIKIYFEQTLSNHLKSEELNNPYPLLTQILK
jgi:hypothetical protein